MTIIDKIQNIKTDLPNKESRVAIYILENINIIPTLTVSELAFNANTSVASISRLCSRLRIKGYKELKIKLIDFIYNNQEINYMHIDKAFESETLLSDIYENTVNYLEMVKDKISKNSISKAVEYINTSSTINLYGIGASSIVTQDLQQKLIRIGINSNIYSDTHLQIISGLNLNKYDLGIIFSYSGETKEMRNIAKTIKNSPANLISITKDGKNTISALSDLNLSIPICERRYRLGASISRFGMLFIVDAIYAQLIDIRKKDGQLKINKTFHAIDNLYRT